MTTTTDRTVPAVKDPRDLIPAELFGKRVERVERVQEEIPVATFYAEWMVEQGLMFLTAVAANPPMTMLTPSQAVDPDAFVLHNPANLLITPDDRVHVIDWGFARRGAAWVELAKLMQWLIGSANAERWRELTDNGLPPWAEDIRTWVEQWAEYRHV
jgi:hypothetical protein